MRITYGGPSLKNIRKAAGFRTAKDFANSVGIPPTTYARYEQKPNHIPMVTAINLADWFNVPLDEIIGRVCTDDGSELEMSETGYKCPKCGNTKSFDAKRIILMGTTHITPDGWNYFDFPNDAMMDDDAAIECCECGYEGTAFEFSRACTNSWWPREEE